MKKVKVILTIMSNLEEWSYYLKWTDCGRMRRPMKESDKDALKIVIYFFIASNISSFFVSRFLYTKSKFDLFITLFPYIIFFIYLIKKIIYCIKEKKTIRIHLLFLCVSFYDFYMLYKDVHNIFTSK